MHLIGDKLKQRQKCCNFGKFLLENSAYPKLKPLPNEIRKIAVNKINHFSKNCTYYNMILSIASIGVDNGKGGGFERINGESCVKLNGRTYVYLQSSNKKGSGINYFTFDALLDMQNSIDNLNSSMNSANSNNYVNPHYMNKIYSELKQINPFAEN